VRWNFHHQSNQTKPPSASTSSPKKDPPHILLLLLLLLLRVELTLPPIIRGQRPSSSFHVIRRITQGHTYCMVLQFERLLLLLLLLDHNINININNNKELFLLEYYHPHAHAHAHTHSPTQELVTNNIRMIPIIIIVITMVRVVGFI